MCTRRASGRWLPWRLGRFLDWCYHAGLVRIAGNGYQFRHRELQDYLAAHPTPDQHVTIDLDTPPRVGGTPSTVVRYPSSEG